MNGAIATESNAIPYLAIILSLLGAGIAMMLTLGQMRCLLLRRGRRAALLVKSLRQRRCYRRAHRQV